MHHGRYAALALVAGSLATGCAIGVRQEIALGEQYAAQLKQELPLIATPAIEADLDLIVRRLTPFARRREITYRFSIVNSGLVNAFAVPGGFIYLTRGLIETAASLDQLAGVIGHEMAHIELRHSAEQIGRTRAAQAGIEAALILLGDRRSASIEAGASVAGQLLLANFSREDERAADRAALDLVTAARINPGGLAEMFETMQSLERSQPTLLESFFASHPMTGERVAEVKALVARNPAAQSLLVTGERDAPEFRRLKVALRALAPPPDGQR